MNGADLNSEALTLFFLQMKVDQTQKGRVGGQKYSELPEGHRTTFVVGMCDMLEFASLYASQDNKPRLDAVLDFAGKYSSGDLRKLFDNYISADASRLKHGAAANFFNALSVGCNFDNGEFAKH